MRIEQIYVDKKVLEAIKDNPSMLLYLPKCKEYIPISAENVISEINKNSFKIGADIIGLMIPESKTRIEVGLPILTKNEKKSRIHVGISKSLSEV